MKGRITLGDIVNRLVNLHEVAVVRKDIKKPWAWALYQTWEWCDLLEKPKEAEQEEK